MNAQEILERYAAGQRDCSRVSLIQVCLANDNLNESEVLAVKVNKSL